MPIESKMLSEAASPKRASFRPRGGTRCRPQHSRDRRLHGIVRSEAESRNALRPSEAIHRRIDDAPKRTQRRIRTVPTRSHRPKPQEACKTGSATGTNRLRGTVKLLSTSPKTAQTSIPSTISHRCLKPGGIDRGNPRADGRGAATSSARAADCRARLRAGLFGAGPGDAIFVPLPGRFDCSARRQVRLNAGPFPQVAMIRAGGQKHPSGNRENVTVWLTPS